LSAESSSPVIELDQAECLDIVRRQRMCVVAVADGEIPYAVPVYYGFDGTSIYLGVAEGRKTRVLDRNPRVHVIIAEPGEGDRWRSVAIAGRATVLVDPVERSRGIEALVAHNRRPDRDESTRSAPIRPRSGGRILRVDEAVITGRARR
jgi:nitroimidazol reductase NimA-like FMN-containing flavoprotein (pyridoxamine 5'-phosphate oxidase superfamily)